jgi:hypothetical protein
MANNVGILTVTPVDVTATASVGASSTSELMAINTMLSVIGEMPVSSLTSAEATPAVAIAQNILGEVRREVDSRGWHYNTEQDVVLSPDDASNINVPVNIIRLDVKVGNYTSKDITQRDGRLYDLIAHSYAFTEDIKVDAVYYLAWGALPEIAKRYMMIRGARILQDRIIGDQTQNAFTSRDEFMALTDLKEYEGDTGDYTMLDSYAVNKTLFTGPLARVPR